MKREGRQHGMVRTYATSLSPWDVRPKPRNASQLGSPPIAGNFAKVSSKPTNHSKFTGKCGRPKCRGCHDCPPTKSKDKVKGPHKIQSASSELVRFKLSGFSATGVLGYLVSDDHVDDLDDVYDDDVAVDHEISSDQVFEIDEEVDVGNHGVVLDEDDDDDVMSFCEVVFNWGNVDGDESWCLVEEM